MKTPSPMRMLFRAGAAVALLAAPGARAETILHSRHNLSVSGTGDVRASTETEVCIFCHTPHGGSNQAPLWNRFDAVGSYTPYTSSTSKAAPGQPTGSSKLCLSCHDGTVALGMVRSRTRDIDMADGHTHMPAGATNLGQDLSDDHPVSFPYDASLAQRRKELRNPASLTGEVRLDRNGEMQCTSCHDPHNNQFGDFLVVEDVRGALCLECHDPDYWDASIHNLDTSTWSGAGDDPWPASDHTTVRDNACANCHRSHNAGTPERLLTFLGEERNCLVCHSGNVAARNMEPEFRKPSAHDVFAYIGVHDPGENVADSAPHIECVDCHNPHAMQAAEAGGGGLSGALLNVAGVTSDGATVAAIQQESELCYRCHGDYPHTDPIIPRHHAEPSVRMQFLAANDSFHPVESMGVNPDVPSLMLPYDETSQITCTSCHNNDQGPNTGGAGPNGPHGSIFHPLLERRLEMADGFTHGDATYAMCYKCHDPDSITANESFAGHFQHVVDEKTSCITCHDPHGVQGATHLINFNLNEVTPFDGRLEYLDNGAGDITCTLTCHTVEHNDFNYLTLPPTPGPPVPSEPTP